VLPLLAWSENDSISIHLIVSLNDLVRMSEVNQLLAESPYTDSTAQKCVTKRQWNGLVKLGIQKGKRTWIVDGLEHGSNSWNTMINYACFQGDCQLLDQIFDHHSKAEHDSSTLWGVINWDYAFKRARRHGGKSIIDTLNKHFDEFHPE
jgi:hypothetical protein